MPEKRSWWRWVLASAVAGLIPLTMASSSCQKTTVKPPPRDSGVVDTAADLAPAPDGDTPDGSPADGTVDTGPDAAPVCCMAGTASFCVDGKVIASCNGVSSQCPSGKSSYMFAWTYQTCPGTCAADGGLAGATCR